MKYELLFFPCTQKKQHTNKYTHRTVDSSHSGKAESKLSLMFLPQRAVRHQPSLTDIKQWHKKLFLPVVRTEKGNSHIFVVTVVLALYDKIRLVFLFRSQDVGQISDLTVFNRTSYRKKINVSPDTTWTRVQK